MRRQIARLLFVLFMTVLFGAQLQAQQATAKIVGTITDQQNAVLDGVEIRATNLSTNAVNSTISDKDGYYQILDLPIGTYHVGAIPGFAHSRRTRPGSKSISLSAWIFIWKWERPASR